MSDMRLDFPITVGSIAPLTAAATATDKLGESVTRAGTAFNRSGESIARAWEQMDKWALSSTKATSVSDQTTASVQRQTIAVQNLGVAHQKTVSDVIATAGVLSVLEGRMNQRSIEQFTTKVLGLGSAFQFLFPIAGAIAGIEMLGQIAEKIYNIYEAWSPARREAERYLEVTKAIASENFRLEGQQRGDIIKNARYSAEVRQRGTGSAAGLRTEAALLDMESRDPTLRLGDEKAPVTFSYIQGERAKQQAILRRSWVERQTQGGSDSPIRMAQSRLLQLQNYEEVLQAQSQHLRSEAQYRLLDAQAEERNKGDEASRRAEAQREQVAGFRRSMGKLDDEAGDRDTGPFGRLLARRQEEIYSRGDQASKLGLNAGGIERQVIADFNQMIGSQIGKTVSAARGQLPSDEAAQAGFGKLDSKFYSESLRQQGAEGAKGLRQLIAAAERGDEADVRSLTGRAGRAARFAQAAGGPGDEEQIINVAYRERLEIAKEIYAVEERRVARMETGEEKTNAEMRARASQQEELDKASEERQLALMELQKKDREEWRSTVVGGFEAAVSGGGNGLANYARSQGLKIAGTVVGNIADTQYRKGFFNIPGLNPNSGIGQMFKNTPLVGGSEDPSIKLSSAADRQITAAAALESAARAIGSFFFRGGSKVGGGGVDTSGAPSLSMPAPILSSGSVGAIMGSNAYSDGSYLPESGRSDPMASLNAALGGAPNITMSHPSLSAESANILAQIATIKNGGGAAAIEQSAMNAIKSSLGVAKLLGKQDSSISLGAGHATTVSAFIGGATLAAGGIFSAINAFSHGGSVRGDLQGAGGVATAIGGIASIIKGVSPVLDFLGPVGAVIGPILTIASMLFGDPKAVRQKHINKILATAQFYAPVSLDVTAGFSGGGAIRYNAQGQIQSTDQSPYPTIQNPYLDFRNGTYVPGRVLVDYGGAGPGMGPGVGSNSTTSAMPSTAPTTAIPLTDQNINEFHQHIAAAMTKALQLGGAGTDHLTQMRMSLGV